MSQVLEQVNEFASAIAALRPASAERLAALEKYLQRGLPGSKDEEWKYTSLRLLGESKFAPGAEPKLNEPLLESLPGLEAGIRLVFVNGRFSEAASSREFPAGLVFRSLSESAPPRLGLIANLEGKLGSTNDERFAHLNAALYSDGVWLEIADGKVIEAPIHIVFLSTPGALSFPRVFVKSGRNAQAKIVEYHAGDGAYATFPVGEFTLSEDSIIEHTRIQIDSPEAFHIGTLAISQEAASTYTSNNVQFGAKIGRLDANVWVGGEHAETWLNGAYVGSGDQQLDNHTRIDHAVPNCHSFEVYKGILSDRAIGVFNGKIFVYPDAQKTDAKQTNQALLLSPTATVNTKPQLEIFADDVKCTHGATVGQLREDAMFYLRSRGLPKAEATNLLVYAFVAEVLERITVETVKDALEARLFEKLRQRL